MTVRSLFGSKVDTQQVAEGVYVIPGPLGVPSVENQGFINNPAFVIGQGGVVLIDPGVSVQIGEMVLRQMRHINLAYLEVEAERF